jgi:hypothetical protein
MSTTGNQKKVGPMDHIANLTFTPGRQMGLWCGDDELKRIKEAVGSALHVGHDRLNEIALEDIEVERDAQQRIFSMLYDLTMVAAVSGDTDGTDSAQHGVPCTGFWIEGTLELILHAWNDYQSKTIVIPSSEWFLREDIIVH